MLDQYPLKLDRAVYFEKQIFGWAQVAYVVVTMADSPRPGVWALEKSMDGGKTWKPWQFFAGTAPSVQCLGVRL